MRGTLPRTRSDSHFLGLLDKKLLTRNPRVTSHFRTSSNQLVYTFDLRTALYKGYDMVYNVTISTLLVYRSSYEMTLVL